MTRFRRTVRRLARAGWLAPVVVALVTFVAFLPALKAGWVTWDDDKNFLENPAFRGLGPEQLRWMWTTLHLGHYVPLSWMSLGLDYVLHGMEPAGYHLTNLVLHSANATLMFFVARHILRSAFGDGANASSLAVASSFAALLWAVHPLRVESVAWVTERRDVLSGFFYLATLLFYLRSRAGGATHYAFAIVAFACALLSKATAVTLPVVLLILECYPLRNLGGPGGWWSDAARRAYRRLALFFALAVAAGVLAIVAVKSNAVPQLSPAGKAAVSAWSLAFYLWKTVAPLNLAALYPMPENLDPLGGMFLAACAVVAVLTAAAWLVRRRAAGVAWAWIAFVLVLLPLLGVHQNGPQVAADRYTYNAAPALALLAAAGFLSLRRPLAALPLAAAAACIAALGTLTWKQTMVWRDSESLWSRAVAVAPESPIAHNDLGNVLLRQNRDDEALVHYETAVRLRPAYLDAALNAGIVLFRQGKLPESIARFRDVLARHPESAEAHNNLGVALARSGDLGGAMAEYREALARNAGYPDAHVNLGNALVRSGKPAEAPEHYRQALALRPDHADAEFNWGVALAQQNRLAEAAEHFRATLALQPGNTDARAYLDRIIATLNK